MAPEKFDVVVVGSGSAASQIVSTCKAAGKSVAIIDEKPFGGTCVLRGCDPKKVLVGAADAVDWARRMHGCGVAGDTHIDWPELMRFKRTFTEHIPRQRAEGYAHEGIEAVSGTARFTAPDRIAVNGREIVADRIALACGMRPATLGISGEDKLIDSEHFLDLDELPKSIVFVGGGYIAFEFGHLAARAGAEVTIVHRGERPLEGFDPELTMRLVDRSRRIGIRVELGNAVERVEGNTIHAGGKVFSAALLVHAAGRVPNLDHLDLKTGNVAFDIHGVQVDRYLRSVSNPAVYAAGDCAASGTPALTPVAGYEGRIAAANILVPASRRIENPTIPSTVFSIPPMARAGLTEQEAHRQGMEFEVHTSDSSSWYSSRRIGEECSGSKVLVERGTDRILGAHLLGHGCEETINTFALAIQAGLTAGFLKEMLFAYPTNGSDIRYRVG
jgi:glutathione reductase (NADPH)